MKTIVRKDTGDDYTTYLKKLCEAQGVENPTVEDARRMDRKRKGKKMSNKDWKSPTYPNVRIVQLKDRRTRLGYKAEHIVDLATGAVVAAELYRADEAALFHRQGRDAGARSIHDNRSRVRRPKGKRLLRLRAERSS
jgi:transposase